MSPHLCKLIHRFVLASSYSLIPFYTTHTCDTCVSEHRQMMEQHAFAEKDFISINTENPDGGVQTRTMHAYMPPFLLKLEREKKSY